MKESEYLQQIIKSEYDQLDSEGAEAISPASLSQRVYEGIDPSQVSPVMVQYAAVMHIRQMIRSTCRTHQREFEALSESQTGLFPQLQPRYPAERNGEDCYVLREKLTYEERAENISRLRSEASAKHAHADALQAETDSLVALGVIQHVEPVEV